MKHTFLICMLFGAFGCSCLGRLLLYSCCKCNSRACLFYFQSSGAFHRNSLRLPSLFLYSRADPIGVADIIEGVMDQWRLQDVCISHKCWDHSPHVSHFHHHPDEYVETLLAFLDSIGFSTPEQQEGEREKDIMQQTIQQAQPVREQHRK